MLHSSSSNNIHNSSNHNSDDATGKGRDGSAATAAAAAANAMSSFKLILLVFMVLQNSSTVLVGRYTRSTSASIQESDLYVVNHFLVVTETAKLLLAALLESWTTRGKLFKSLHQHCFQNPMDALKIMVPALLYLVQNTLLYVALGNLTAPIFQGMCVFLTLYKGEKGICSPT
jgi:Nucleotide-sugar transporter